MYLDKVLLKFKEINIYFKTDLTYKKRKNNVGKMLMTWKFMYFYIFGIMNL